MPYRIVAHHVDGTDYEGPVLRDMRSAKRMLAALERIPMPLLLRGDEVIFTIEPEVVE